MLYLCSPLAWISVAVLGENHLWRGVLWALAIWSMSRGKHTCAGVFVALSATLVKFSGFLIAPVLWLWSRKPLSFAMGLAVSIIGCMAPLFLRGADVFQPLRFEARDVTSGNVWYLVLPRAALAAGIVRWVANTSTGAVWSRR